MNENKKNAIKAGIVFGIVMGICYNLIYGVLVGMIGGIISGVFFGLFIGIFLKIMKKNFEKNKPQITSDKPLIKDGPANHFKKLEAVGGWLFLTAEELIFNSHSMNIQNHELIIPLNQITEVKVGFTFKVIKNGLHIATESNTLEKFVVNNPNNWVEKIKNAIKGTV